MAHLRGRGFVPAWVHPLRKIYLVDATDVSQLRTMNLEAGTHAAASSEGPWRGERRKGHAGV